ncbi:hypothetical protein ASPCADRAFT_400774 [Aspergillus carbonarius ITEM 5010]|uniref:Zn(2)-C6 fungal-type domain-containing protein n=1 Tax=Aspergillus carbonarius (strain ITEM 5010) TaxID=602072 RepID=A0A1R3R7X0_ASPC5|nr:hypothetical protein ASPCADRAFT_400774 [Aspergillus carbonarius ITEM 5010]
MHPMKRMIPRVHTRTTFSSSRSRTVQACDVCRKRKAKCNGETPIQRVERMLKLILSRAGKHSSTAIGRLESLASSTHKGPSTRAQPNLRGNLDDALKLVQSELTDLHQVYQTIQECDSDVLPLSISSIRASTSVHDAATRLGRRIPLHQPLMTLEKMQQVWLTRLSGQVEMIEQQAPYSVHTTNLWSTLENPTWRVIEPQLFLNSFATGDTGFRSSLLLHTILFYALLLGLFLCGSGKDKIGVRYIQYSTLMAMRLGLHTSSAEAFRNNPWAHKVIACGTSSWPGPPEVFLGEDEALAADLNDQWRPYPFRTPVCRPYANTGTRARRCFLILVNDVVQLSSDLGTLIDLDSWQRGAAVCKKLEAFKRTLPRVLESILPHHVINLCGAFISCRTKSTKDTLAAVTNFDPQQILEAAMDSMGALILTYCACQGWKSIPVIMLHYFLLVRIHAASRLELPKWREILVTCAAGLWHMSLTWRVSRAFLRTIELVLNSNADIADIPKEAQSILEEHHEKIWTRDEVDQLASPRRGRDESYPFILTDFATIS